LLKIVPRGLENCVRIRRHFNITLLYAARPLPLPGGGSLVANRQRIDAFVHGGIRAGFCDK